MSNRELEVARLVTKGFSNQAIADRLFVTEKTIKFHLTNIYSEVGVTTRTQLAIWMMKNEVSPEERAEFMELL